MLNRQQHIGMYGYNRKKGNNLEGNTFEERVENLRNIITDAEKMTQFSGDQRYQDYKAFNSKLDEWDGTLKIINKKW
jgi:hypothetical protein